MCVILTVEKQRPSLAMLRAAITQNPDGNGIAWREDGRVRFEKGLDADDFIARARTVPIPYVAHARVATVGGVTPELTHPFPIGGGDGSLSGQAQTVLFHNGTWHEWKETMLRAITSGRDPMPQGPWSDSRAMAWLAGRYGSPILPLLMQQQRVVLFSETELVRLGTWVNLGHGLHASNAYFCRHLATPKSKVKATRELSLVPLDEPLFGRQG